MKPIDPYEYLRMKIVRSNPRFSSKAFIVQMGRRQTIVADESIRLGDILVAVKKVMTEGAPKDLLNKVFKYLVVAGKWNIADDLLHHQTEQTKKYLCKILLKEYGPKKLH
jgi:hypothetical protein